MSLWSAFTNWGKGIVQDVSGIAATTQQTAIQGAAGLVTPQVAQAAGTAAPETISGLQTAAQEAIAKTAPVTPTKASSDLLLQASKPVNAAFSYAVNRPISTIGLLTDANSPLYSSTGPMGQGFQFSDIAKAYDRSAKVSPFQALTKSSIFQDSPFGYLADQALKAGKVDLKNVNLWDDQDIKKNFTNNTIGKIFTGIGDFVVSNVAGAAVTGFAGDAASLITKASNLTTVIDTANDLAKLDSLADSHITNIQSNGAMGTKTVFGSDVQQLANTNNMNLILNKVRDYSNNDQLPSLIAKTNNPSIVKDLLLADKGYQPSLNRLLNNSPADLWQLGDVNSFIKGNVAASGIMPEYDAATLKNVQAAYDQSINEIPSHRDLYEAFHDGTGSQTLQGTNYKPIDPPVLGGTIGAIRNRAAEIAAASETRSFEGLGGVSETILGGGSNRPVTAILRFIGTSKPRGYITYQGARPWDGADEINAVFDDIRKFTNGDTPITTGFEEVNGQSLPIKISAAEYRSNAIKAFMDAKTSAQKDAVIKNIDENLGKHLFYSYGITSDAEINNFINDSRGALNKLHTQLSQDGFAFDGNGRRLIVDPMTQRQLADSRPMLPWGKIERDIRAQVKGGVKGLTTETLPGVVHNIFESLNKTFSIAVLGRPSYIPKNSVAEPLITAFLSMGNKFLEDSIGTVISNGVKNNTNRILSAVRRTGSMSNVKNANELVAQKMSNLGEALHIRDAAQAEWENAFKTDNLSPATKIEHLETIKSNLRSADAVVNRIEADINIASKEYALSDKIPSVYNIRRRIEFLKSQPQGATRYASEISRAELVLQKAVGNITTLSPEIAEHNKALESAWNLLDKVVQEKGLAEKEQGESLAKIEASKKRYYGKQEPHVLNIGGKQVKSEVLFDPDKFGDALKNEFSNEDTIEQTFLSEARIGAKQGLLSRKAPNGTVDINSPVYYEELAYVVNRQMRGDPLVNMVLKGDSAEVIKQWAETSEGQRYLRQFGYENPSDLPVTLQDRIDFVNRYLPDAAARKYALNEPVTSLGLQRLLADKPQMLSPIHPTDINYGSAATLGKWNLFSNEVLKTMNKFYGGLMRAENPYRWAWADKKFQQIVGYKLDLLNQQNIPITAEQVNAVRQAAVRETLAESEKTFYTVRRQNRALYAARTVFAFPTASTNAMYRFGRLAVKYPGRSAGFMRNYYGLYSTFGVDKDGNPVSDPTQAAYIVVPGTKEMGLFGDKGIRLSTKAFGFLVNLPGPSFLSTFAVQNILNNKPDNEQIIKRVVNDTIGHLPGMDYDSLFPASSTSGTSSFIPSWVSDLKKGLAGSDTNGDFLSTHRLVHNYLMTLWEMKLGPKPTFKQEMNMTKDFYLQRAGWRFGSPFGMTPQMDKPGQLFQDLATNLLKKNNGDYNKAQAELLQVLGPDFSADRYLFRGNTKSAYVSPSLQGYERVFKDNSLLVAQLADLDPKTVSLLSSDLNGDPANQQVQSFLMNAKVRLPGGTVLNNGPMTAQQYEESLQVNRTWNTYRTQKQAILDALKTKGYKRMADVPAMAQAWNGYVAQLGKYDPKWYNEYIQNAAGDNSYTYAKALQTIVDDKNFMTKNGSNDFWKQAATFISYRNQLTQAYASAPTGTKTAIKAAWQNYLQQDTAGSWNPQLQQIIDRYFINDTMKGTN